MANNTEAYCPDCNEVTIHFADIEGWVCDECDHYNDRVFENPYKED